MSTPGEQLGPLWGHLAGWGFVVGKIASAAAMALTAGAYAVAGVRTGWSPSPPSSLIVAVNLGGITRTVARDARCPGRARCRCSSARSSSPAGRRRAPRSAASRRSTPEPPSAILRSAGLPVLRLRRLRPDRDPRRGGPRSRRGRSRERSRWRSACVLVVYAVGRGHRARRRPGRRARRHPTRRCELVVEAAGADGLAPVVRVGAASASLGVLLNLIPGISRTVLAMARRRELPGAFADVDARHSLPRRPSWRWRPWSWW